MKKLVYIFVIIFLLPNIAFSQRHIKNGKVQIAMIRNPQGASQSILDEGLLETLKAAGGEIVKNETFNLNSDEKNYRGWARASLVNRHMGNLISVNGVGQYFSVGLLQSCSDLNGMLAGVQNMGPGQADQTYHLAGWGPRRVGLIYFDAHADVNSPETTLSGMYGGMDVAHAIGLFNQNARIVSGLDPPLPPDYVVLGDIRDTDPKEMELIRRLQIELISTEDIRQMSGNIRKQMDRLSKICDEIYIHIDMDVLAPEEVLGHGLTAPNGPTSIELARCVEFMARYPKTSAIGIASTPFGSRDPDHISTRAAVRLIEAAIKGAKKRK